MPSALPLSCVHTVVRPQVLNAVRHGVSLIVIEGSELLEDSIYKLTYKPKAKASMTETSSSTQAD